MAERGTLRLGCSGCWPAEQGPVSEGYAVSRPRLCLPVMQAAAQDVCASASSRKNPKGASKLHRGLPTLQIPLSVPMPMPIAPLPCTAHMHIFAKTTAQQPGIAQKLVCSPRNPCNPCKSHSKKQPPAWSHPLEAPEHRVFDHEGVGLGQLVAGPGCVVRPDVAHIYLRARGREQCLHGWQPSCIPLGGLGPHQHCGGQPIPS